MIYQGFDPPLARIREETASNFQALQRLRPTLRIRSRYALMRSGMIIEHFPSRHAAMLVGYERFIDRIFSIHRLTTS